MLIATFDQDEATVVQVEVDQDTLFRAIQDPDHAAHRLGGGRPEE